MTNRSDTDAIEAAIERDRHALASTIGVLQERISVEHLAQEALGLVKTNAAAYGRTVDKAVRANPLALALTGAGIAWLVFGNRNSDEERAQNPKRRSSDDHGGRMPWPDSASTMVDSLSAADVAGASDWLEEIDGLRDRATRRLHALEAEARGHASSVRNGISEGLGKARDFAAERADVLSGFAEDMKSGFRKGLDDVSDSARDRIVAARERAYAAKIRAEGLAKSGAREAGRLIEDHPLVAGVLALAVGAAFAAALPRTQVENRAFGAESDRLMEEANRLLRQERARLGRVASGVADEVTDRARDAAQRVSDDVSKSSREAAAAVSDAVADTVQAAKERAGKEAAKPTDRSGGPAGKRHAD